MCIRDREIISLEKEVSYAGYDEWTKLDADMLVNGALHRVKENYRNYIQYGKPKYDVEEMCIRDSSTCNVRD